jgi:hypothetical protein
MRSAFSLAQSHGYESFTFTAYDNVFSDTDIEKIVGLRQQLQSSTKNFMFFTPKGVCWNLNGVDLYDIFYETCVFMGKITPFLSTFNEYFPKTLEDYNTLVMNNTGPGIFEHHFYNAFHKHIADTLIVDSTYKLYFTESRLDLSKFSGTACKILPNEYKDKHYLYLANYDTTDRLFKVYFNDEEVDMVSLNGTIVATTFKISSLLNDTNIRVEVYHNHDQLDTYKLEYKKIDSDKYTDGTVIIRE